MSHMFSWNGALTADAVEEVIVKFQDPKWDSNVLLPPEQRHLGRPSFPESDVLDSSSRGERTVKNLKLQKALIVSGETTVSYACKRMATRGVDYVLLTDDDSLLCGIFTANDLAFRVLAEARMPDQTKLSKVMTRNPVFVFSDSTTIDALQKMAQGLFRHLPVIENGKVTAVVNNKGNNVTASLCLRVATVLASDPVSVAAERMRELRVNFVIIMDGNKVEGILTSKDLLIRVVAQNLLPELTFVEKVMTPNPECATMDTTIPEALRMMHFRKFTHLPVVDKGGLYFL
ncbi:hypothetical protein L2E82_34709 [Cichorium intybus]|uniref:Uncharacterized protein n=1 Tax=Cichorium intybus TaxID=13427 RepID=A0ACB9BML6_CICIN|nr:hypothetical protein L2E82_34709 [Cichorium intybus]